MIDNAYLHNQTPGATALTGWFNGDFNYDGVIDGSDYTLIDNAFNTQGAVLSTTIAVSDAVVTSQTASAVSEPSAILVLGTACLLSLRRRRAIILCPPQIAAVSKYISIRCHANPWTLVRVTPMRAGWEAQTTT